MADSPSAERRLDVAAVRDLLATASADLASRPLDLAAEGWDNAIWRLGVDLAVRVPRRALAADLILHEQRVLPALAPALARLGVQTPVPVIVGRPSELFPWAWSVVPWIDGSPALGRPREENTAWASLLAAALDAVHGSAPADAPANPYRGVPLPHRDAALREHLDGLRSSGLDAVADDLGVIWERGLAAAPARERVWIHGDLHPGNLLVHEGRLAALIDFGDVTAGDPAYDLAASWMLFDADGRIRFRSATAERYDDATWTRARAWAAYLAAVFLTKSDDRPEFRALGESTARAVVDG
ncbi:MULTISPECIES: aminoglycoside phosphotransferase family protein [unclassified Microbacterium]|uniref:aminoglycoside phosphotransferase family protein n=1 Tax=unclassified Microbacterium TaxID=2609290 RepID=UPI00342F91E2